MPSPVEQVTKFAVAATLLRIGDAGAGLGVVLLALTRLGGRGALAGGLLTAALMAPHVLGSRVGRRVDRARDARLPIVAGAVGYGATLALGTVLLDRGAPWAAAPAFLVAGLCGPLLTGGLSSLTAGLGAAPARARGADVITYGVAGTAGPAAVATLAAATSPALSLWSVSGAVLVGSALVLLLPPRRSAQGVQPAATPFVLLRVRALRRVTTTTLAVAATGGALGVLAALLALPLTGRAADGAWLMTTVGLGNLGGSVLALVSPLRAEPVRASLACAGALGVGYLLVAVAPTWATALAACALVGVVTAYWVTATLAARERHAPAGQHAQVFTALAGWKIGAAAAGTAIAGAVAGVPTRTVLAVGAVAILLCVAVECLPEARRGRQEGPTTPTIGHRREREGQWSA